MKIFNLIRNLLEATKPRQKHTKENCDYCYVNNCIDELGEIVKRNGDLNTELLDKLADEKFIKFLEHSATMLEKEEEPKPISCR